MCRRITLFILFLFLITAGAFAETFTVTSNADSGPGTLREALTKAQANGSGQEDYIYFNLPGNDEKSHTIILFSELPHVPANIVIDGSTQPGPGLNKGDAKVAITIDYHKYTALTRLTGAFNITGVNNVEIYGFWIYDFSYMQAAVPGIITTAAILIVNSSHIQIGGPSKGNFMVDNAYSIYANQTDFDKNDAPVDVKIQSNYFDYEPKETSYVAQGVFIFGHDVTFGGDGSLEGNHLLGMLAIDGTNIQVVHNYFGIDKNGNLIQEYPPYISCTSSLTDGVIVRNNISTSLSINLEYMKNFQIYANTDLGSDLHFGYNINMVLCKNGIIGSDDISRQNIFLGHPETPRISNDNSENIQILKNSISCSGSPYDLYADLLQIKIPDFNVLVNNETEFSGTASPNADVYIYEDNTNCPVCNPVIFIEKIQADINGNWKIAGNFKNKRLVANALLNQNSSQFSNPRIPRVFKNRIIAMPSCGRNNGIIELGDLANVNKIEWYNDITGAKLGEGPRITGLAPGNYFAVVSNGGCSLHSEVYQLESIELKIDDGGLNVIQPSCGKNGVINGLIGYVNASDPISYKWTDNQNIIVGAGADIGDLQPGKYSLTAHDEVTGCEASYGPIVLKNTTGPNIDQSTMKIKSTNCGQSTGAITGITAAGTGNLKYVWWDSQQHRVGADKDLLDQPAGVYKLQVTDDTQCGPVYTTDVTIPETNGIILDESKAIKTIASCGQSNGTVTGITANGATRYQWTDANGKTVSSTADLNGVPSGDYTLMVSNNFGCSKTSQVYHIDQPAITQFPQYAATATSSCFHTNSGSISVTTDGLVKSLRWIDVGGGPVGTTAAIKNLTPGNYTLYLTDQNGCEQLYNTYTIGEEPEYTVVNRGEVAEDQCGLKTGGVGNVTISGGVPPYIYKWTDATGNTIGTNSSIAGLASGEYKLNVTDTRCGNVDISYTVNAVSADVAPPSVADVQLCSSGGALLTVNNASASAIYRLYETDSSANPIDEKSGGHFNITVSNNRSYFISQLNGTCESSRAEVKVSVGLSVVDIANIFTPNSDGINDYWQIKSIENYPSAIVQVFTRYGQRVFESKGYNKPFDGTANGKKLPAGVYYYIINLNTNCNVLSGSLTIIR